MAIKPLNSVAGFSVGETPVTIIDGTGNITAVNLDVLGESNFNSISNIFISGGAANQFIQTDGLGNLSFASVDVSQIQNGTSNVKVYNNGNVAVSIAGTPNVVLFTNTGEIVNGIISVTGNANIGNIGTGGIITATGNITGGNLISSANVWVNNWINTPGGTDLVFGPATQVTRNYGNMDPYTGGYYLGGGTRWTGVRANSGDFATTLSAAGNANVGNLGTGGIITSTGNITGGNLYTGGLLSVTGNGNIGNIGTGGLITATGNIDGGNLNTLGTANAGTLTVSGNANIGNIGTGGLITATGNITGGNLVTTGLANINNLSISGVATGNFIPSANNLYNLGNNTNRWKDLYLSGSSLYLGTVTLEDVSGALSAQAFLTVGNANVGNLFSTGVVSAAGNVTGGNFNTAGLANAGTLTVSGNANIGNIGTGGLITATGNIDGGNIITVGRVSGSNVYVTSLGSGQVAIGYTGGQLVGGPDLLWDFANARLFTTGLVSNGNISTSGNITGANIITGGTLSTAGTITGGNLNTAGNLSVGGNASIGNINTNIISATGNIYAGLFVGDVQGNISGNITAPGSNTQILYNANGAVGASSNFTFDYGINSLIITGSESVSGNITGGNLITGGTISATGNANVGNLGVVGVYASSLSSTGNATVGGILTDNYYYANGSPVDFQQPAGSNTEIQFNDNGNFGASGNFTFNSTTNNLALNGNVLLGSTGQNQIVPLSPTALEIRGGWSNATAAQVSLMAGDYANGTNWGKSTMYGNLGGNATFQVEANIFNYQPAGGGANIVKFNSLVPASTSTSTGAIQVAGGVGITGNLNVGSNTTIGSGLSVTGNANIGNVGTGIVTATGNVTGANITTGGVVTATGNVTGGNITTGGVVSASGNVTGGNLLTGGYVSASGDVTASNLTASGTVVTPNLQSSGNIVITPGAGNSVNLTLTGSGNFNVGSYVTNVSYPQLAHDAATKEYVDTMVSSGISYHQAVYAATVDTLANATSGTTAYNSPNGAANGIGAYISTTGTFANVDGVNIATVGTRILVKDESNAAWNGVYTYTNAQAITRSLDADEYGPNSPEQLSINDYFFTQNGNVNKGVAWIVSAPSGTITFGTSNITFSEFSTSQVYDAGTGLTLTNLTFSVNNSQPQITSVGTLTTLSVSGNIGAGNVNTGIVSATGNIIGGANISVAGNITGANITATNAFIGNIQLTGDIQVNSLTSNTYISATGNANVGNLGTGGLITATGNITGGNLVTGGVLTVTGNANIGNIGTGGLITATGNIQGGNLVTGGVISAIGNANVGNLGTGGLITATGNITGGNVITGGVVSAAGNVTGGNLITTGYANVGTILTLGNGTVNTTFAYDSVTTTSVTANQTISSFSVTGITGVEFLVKGIDSTGSKYSVATVQAVTDGTNVDYSTFGTVQLGGYTGSLAVNVVGGYIRLQVTPASSNSTVWTTQYRLI